MTKTMMPGDGGDFGERVEMAAFDDIASRYREERMAAEAIPIGRRILRADVFGIEEFLAPFELPQLNPLALHRSFHN